MLGKSFIIFFLLVLCVIVLTHTAEAETKTATSLIEMDYQDGTPAQVKDEDASGVGHDDDYCIGLEDMGAVGFTYQDFTDADIAFWAKVRKDDNKVICTVFEDGEKNGIRLVVDVDSQYGCEVSIYNRDGGEWDLIKYSRFDDTHLRDRWELITFRVTSRENAKVSADGFDVYVQIGNEETSAIAENLNSWRFSARQFDTISFSVDNQDRTTYIDEITATANVPIGGSVEVGVPGSLTPLMIGLLLMAVLAIYFITSKNSGSGRSRPKRRRRL